VSGYGRDPYGLTQYGGGSTVSPQLPIYTIEIEWVPGTWTDVTSDVVDGSVNIHVGRTSQFDSVQAGSLTLSLNNLAGDYTPDNPLSVNWPNVVEGKRIRVTGIRSFSSRRFLGRLTSVLPTDLSLGGARVDVSATDALGSLGQRILDNDWSEAWGYRSRSEWVDCWPLDDASPTAAIFRNLTGRSRLRLISTGTSVGGAQMGSPDQGILLAGTVDLSPSSTGIGPVMGLDLLTSTSAMDVLGSGLFTFTFKTAQVATSNFTIAAGYDTAGGLDWRLDLHLSGGHTNLWIYNASGSGTQWVDALDGDNSWHSVSVRGLLASSSAWLLDGAQPFSVAVDVSQTAHVLLGGLSPAWQLVGKQAACPEVSFSGVARSTTSITDLSERFRPQTTMATLTRLTELVTQYSGLTLASTGVTNPLVTRTSTGTRSALDCAGQVADTVGGVLYHDYQVDAVRMVLPDQCRPITAQLTITSETDDDASSPMGLSRAIDAMPTRVTATSPAGSVTVVSPSETISNRRDEPFDSCAASVAATQAVAGMRLQRSARTRISQIGLDLATTGGGHDLWSSGLGVIPGSRLVVSGLRAATLGVTAVAGYVAGWAEQWSSTSARLVFDLEPADYPPEGRYSDSTYGRFCWGTGVATVTGGTAVGTTSTGTLVITTSSGPTLTTTASQYPLDLDWDGERVTIGSAPASSTSPQTVTLTARGAGVTVARAHAAPSSIEIFDAATFAA